MAPSERDEKMPAADFSEDRKVKPTTICHLSYTDSVAVLIQKLCHSPSFSEDAINSFISLTARSMPTRTALEIILCPI